MSVRSNSNHKEQERDGDFELVLVAITYTGDRSMYGPQGMRTQGGYPALDQFRGAAPGEDKGETKLVEIPSTSLGWWENHRNFEVSYEETDMAECLLEQNYIPEQVVGPGYDRELRDELIEKLGLEAFTGEDDLRDQLRDIVGIDESEDEVAQVDEPNTRVERLTNEYDRTVLLKVAGSYDEIDDVLEEEDKDAVSHLKSTTVAEFLTERDNDEVDRRLTTAEQGGEI